MLAPKRLTQNFCHVRFLKALISIKSTNSRLTIKNSNITLFSLSMSIYPAKHAAQTEFPGKNYSTLCTIKDIGLQRNHESQLNTKALSISERYYCTLSQLKIGLHRKHKKNHLNAKTLNIIINNQRLLGGTVYGYLSS